MIRSGMKIKSLAFAFLCFYASCYPIFALLLLNQESENVGSLALQGFQGATIFALLPFLKIRFSLRSINVWLVGIVYFSLIALFMATFRAFDEKIVEITFALRFIFWMIFAFVLDADCFSPDRVKKLVYCFVFGGTIQCFIAIACYAFNLGGGSIYSDINASAGSKFVSGKTVVSFVILEIILASYWYVKYQKGRLFSLFIFLLGVATVLVSYNRSGQLALLAAYFWTMCWLARCGRLKLLVASALAALVVAGFLASSYGKFFLERWGQIQQDQGSGRVEIVQTVLENLNKPKSIDALILGRGYHKTKNLMEGTFGVRIGTHSDFSDFLTSYGLVGLVFYFAIICKFFVYVKKNPYNSFARLFGGASTVAFVLMSLATGVFQGTYALLTFLFLLRYYQNEEIRPSLSRDVSTRKTAPVIRSIQIVERNVQTDEFRTSEKVEEQDASTQETNDARESDELESNVEVDSERLKIEDAGESTDAHTEETERVETDRPTENDETSASENEANVVEAEYDKETLLWLKGLDSIFGDVGEVKQMFSKNVDQTVESKEENRS